MSKDKQEEIIAQPIIRFGILETMLDELVEACTAGGSQAIPEVRLNPYWARVPEGGPVTHHAKISATALIDGQIYFWAERVYWYQTYGDSPFSQSPFTRKNAELVSEWVMAQLVTAIEKRYGVKVRQGSMHHLPTSLLVDFDGSTNLYDLGLKLKELKAMAPDRQG